MKIGHICLKNSSSTAAKRFLSIVEGLDRLAIEQHILVADTSLAQRLRALPFATVGPVVRSPVMAYCLMPPVDVVHVHDDQGSQAGLLLTLTRSVPFVLAEGVVAPDSRSPLRKSVLRRAQAIVDCSERDAETLLTVYGEAAGPGQNSQRTPTAGSSGSQ